MRQQIREKGLAHLGLIIAVVVVVAAVAFGGWYVWDKNKNDKNSDGKNNSSQNNGSDNESGEESKIPKGYIVYENKEFGFSFAYPEEVGALMAANSENSDIVLYARSADNKDAFAPYTSSSLDVQINKKDGFLTRAGKYGPILEFKNGKWIVSDKEGGDILNAGYTIGAEYKPSVVRTIKGISIYDLSFADEGCHRTVWVFERSSTFVTVTLPSVCADEIDAIPQERLAGYREVSDEVLATLMVD